MNMKRKHLNQDAAANEQAIVRSDADEARQHAADQSSCSSHPSRANTSWGSLLLIIGALSCALVGIQFFGWESPKPSLDFAAIVGLGNLAIYLWIRIGSHWRMPRQVGAIIAIVLLQAVLCALLRIDGFAGDGRFIFAWRWEETPEQRWTKFANQTAPLADLPDLARIQEDDSPAFRGADRSGQFFFRELDTDWNERAPRLLWRHPVGPGWSSFAVVGSSGVTQEQRGEQEAVVCYDIRTGQEIWQHNDRVRFEEITSGPGPRATPAIDEGRVYTLGATGVVNCLEGATGAIVWQRTITDVGHASVPPLFGYASSPLIYQDKLVIAGGAAGSLIAFSTHDGTLLWRAEPRAPGYSSPQLWHGPVGDQVVLLDGVGVHGHDLQTGRVLWSAAWGDGSEQEVNVCQPSLVRAEANGDACDVLVSSGYGRGTALFGVAYALDSTWRTHERWHSRSLESKFSCLIVRDQHAYGLDKGILTCVSLIDGTRRWKRGRYGYGQLIALNDLILVQAEDGRVVLVRADEDAATEVAVIPALSDRTWNHPVIAAGHLLVRNDREAACYALPTISNDSRSVSP